MPNVYARISEAASEVQVRLADVLEARRAEPHQQAMLRAFLTDIDSPDEAKMLEVGCGTGAVTRTLTHWRKVDPVVVTSQK
jgi:hypothetical protein